MARYGTAALPLPIVTFSRATRVRVFWALTRYHLRRLEMKKAEATCGVALAAAQQLYESIGVPADQARFLHCHLELLAKVVAAFKLVGREDLAETVQSHFPPPGATQLRQRERQRQRNRRFLLLGLGVALGQSFLALPRLLLLPTMPATPRSIRQLTAKRRREQTSRRYVRLTRR